MNPQYSVPADPFCAPGCSMMMGQSASSISSIEAKGPRACGEGVSWKSTLRTGCVAQPITSDINMAQERHISRSFI
jgi:hypothetical protein